MSFVLGKTLAYYLAGYNFSGNSNKYDAELNIEALDSTCFGPSAHKTQEPGLLTGKISVGGLLTATVPPDVTGYQNQLTAALRTETVGLVCLPGAGTLPAAGDLADLWLAATTSPKVGVTVDQLITLDADFETKTGLHLGTVMAAETAYSPSPVQTAYYDQGGAGWVSASTAYLVDLQVTAYTSGMAALAVETSTDHSSWTPRGTFPAITAVGGYALALTTTLDRYIRINGTGVGTVIVGFARTN